MHAKLIEFPEIYNDGWNIYIKVPLDRNIKLIYCVGMDGEFSKSAYLRRLVRCVLDYLVESLVTGSYAVISLAKRKLKDAHVEGLSRDQLGSARDKSTKNGEVLVVRALFTRT